jgi:signal transduction histidine kinase
VRFDGPIDTVASEKIAEHAAAALREMLANVARHAEATSATVLIEATAGGLTLTVTDDGRGIGDVGAGGRGIANLRARAAALSGRFAVEARSDRSGTVARWAVPNLTGVDQAGPEAAAGDEIGADADQVVGRVDPTS